MKRRDFFKATAALTVGGSAQQLPAQARPAEPPRAVLKVHRLHLEPRQDSKFILLSDGLSEPRKLIRPEVLDRAFGNGTFEALNQPDHWRMIDGGWFTGDDLYLPSEFEDPQYRIWYANYRPECEAHDLLFDLFSDRVEGFISYTIPNLGLEFAEHPCTPRLATVKIVGKRYLSKLIREVEVLTKWIIIEPKIAAV